MDLNSLFSCVEGELLTLMNCVTRGLVAAWLGWFKVLPDREIQLRGAVSFLNSLSASQGSVDCAACKKKRPLPMWLQRLKCYEAVVRA